MENRAGKYVKNLYGELEYKSFCPTPLPPEIEMDGEMIDLLVKANKEIAVLDSISSMIPNIDLFVYMYIRKEAILSSQIEGTQCTLEDLFNPNNTLVKNKDVPDVVNYIKATEYCLERIKTLPLCNRFLKEAHSVLIDNVRGKDKKPGEFRRSQNWIGGQGSTLKDARYIPPNLIDMDNAMSDLEKFINNEDEIDKLIKIALIHYQFETIHPFLDGNGRIGRLLITLYLMENKILNSPALYISYYLKKNRIEYYDRMTEVRRTGNYEQWIKFFLTAIIESSKDAINTINEITVLHNKNVDKIGKENKKLLNVFLFLESNPIVDVNKVAKGLSMSFNTATKYIKTLIEYNILKAVDDAERNRIFEYSEYLNILRRGI